MNNKFKVFVKKIKNWLSSLSKWAQKHKLKLFSCFCLMFLLFGNLMTCSNNKKTASASQVVSDTPILFIPSISVKYSGKDFSTVPFFLVSNTNNFGVYLQSYDNKTQYDISSFNVNYDNTTLTTSFARLKRYGIPNYDDNQYVGLGLYPYENFYFRLNIVDYPQFLSMDPNSIINFIFSRATHMYITVDNYSTDNSLVHSPNYLGYIQIRITEGSYNVLGTNVLFNLVIRDLYTFDNTYDLFSSNVQFLSPSVDINEYAEMQYNLGYSSGYSNGYQAGYDGGYAVGIADGADNDNLSPFKVLSRGIDNLFSLKLFGDIGLGDILRIGFACVLLGFTIKIFLGG